MSSTYAQVKRYRERYPERRRSSDAKYRHSAAGELAHQKYNGSEKGRKNLADYHLRVSYGKTLEEKKQQRELQQGLCGVCQKPLPDDIRKCYWDHNHRTGQMRELLHGKCNLAVGIAEGPLLSTALIYLRRYNDV